MLRSLVPCKENQDILGFRISGTGFQSLSVEVGFWIPIFSRIPDSTSKNFTNSGIRIPLHGAGTEPLPCTRVFLERFFRESRISSKSHKPVSKTYRPKNDNFCLLMTLGFHF